MKYKIEKIKNIIYLDDKLEVIKEQKINSFAIDLTEFTKRENYKGSVEYLFLLISNNYQMDLKLLSVNDRNVKIEKDYEMMSSSVPTDYQGLLSLFLATERFSKDKNINFNKEDILFHFKKTKSVFNLDINKFNNAMKPFPYKLTIYYNWRKVEKKIAEIKFSLKDNFKDSLLINIGEHQIKYFVPLEEWYKFIGMNKSVLELDKQFILHDNRYLLNLPFNKNIQEPYSVYLKKYYKDKYIPVNSKLRANVTITYELEFI